MQVLVRTHAIDGGAGFERWAKAEILAHADRFAALLTRAEAHLSDENASKGGAQDKHCLIEFHPKGHQPMTVEDRAASIEQALTGAARKMRHALEHLDGRLDSHRLTPTGELFDPLAEEDRPAVTDALRQQEFLARQQQRGKR